MIAEGHPSSLYCLPSLGFMTWTTNHRVAFVSLIVRLSMDYSFSYLLNSKSVVLY